MNEVHQLATRMRHIGGWFLRRMHTADAWAHAHQSPSQAGEIAKPGQGLLLPSDADAPSPAPDAGMREIARAAAVVRAALKGSSEPLKIAAVAQQVLAEVPQMRNNNWGGTGRFGNFVEKHLPDVVVDRSAPGHLYYRHKVHGANSPKS